MKNLLIDLGGTNTKFAWYENHSLSQKTSIPTELSLGFDSVVERIIKHIESEYKGFDDIAISQAGVIARDGSIYFANEKMVGFTGRSLAEELNKKFGVPANAYNDVKSSAAFVAKSIKDRDATVLTIGTGIGSAVISEGHVSISGIGMNGEIGQIDLDSKNLDSEISLAAFAEKVRKKLPDYELDQSEEIFGNNDFFKKEMKAYIDTLGTWVYNTAFIYGNLDIYIGGALDNFGPWLLDKIHELLKTKYGDKISNEIKVHYAPKGNDANLIGAHILSKLSPNR